MNKITRILINTALVVLKKFVLDKIQYAPVQALTQTFHLGISEVALIVTDNDPDNATQLKEYFNANKTKLAASALQTLQEVVAEEIKDDTTREILSGLLEQIEQALKEG